MTLQSITWHSMTLAFDPDDSPMETSAEYPAVMYCTGCGTRLVHPGAGGILTTTWRLTPREIRAIQRELPKMRCDVCHGPMDLRVVGPRAHASDA
jgi:hypothetical protein